jgi:hypothetical protein
MTKREPVPPAPRAHPHVGRVDLPAARAQHPVLHHDLLAPHGTPDNYQYNPYYKRAPPLPPQPPTSPPDSLGQSSSSHAGTESIAQSVYVPVISKVKERDIKFAQLPEAPDFDSWKDAAFSEIVSAAQRGYSVTPWINKVDQPGVTFDDLADSEGYEVLDANLCAAIFKIKNGDLGRNLTLASKELRARGGALRGRQALHMVYSEYAIDIERGALYDLSDLMLLSYTGDNNLPRFLADWLHTVQGLSEPQPEGNLKVLLYEQLVRSEALSSDMAYYRRIKKDDPDKTYPALLAALKRYCDDLKKTANRKKTQNRLSGGGRNAVHALPAADTADALPVIDACLAFTNTGNCRFGDNCKYSHGPAAPGEPKSKPGAKAEAKGKGKGKDAKPKPTDKELADRAKQPCNNFSKGRCRFADKCHYSHDIATPAFDNDPTAIAIDITTPAFDIAFDTEHPCDAFALISQDAAARHYVNAWAIDTASANHLIGRKEINNADIGMTHELRHPRRLATANGVIVVDKGINVAIESLDTVVDPIIMGDCPAVLSVGRLCMESGYSFNWPAFHKPTLTKPDGSINKLELQNLVPVLRQARDSAMGLPAPDALDADAPVVQQAPASSAEPPAGEPAPAPSRAELEAQAAAARSHLMTHTPKRADCDICRQAKLYKKQARRKDPDLSKIRPTKINDLLWSDHIIVGKKSNSRGIAGEKVGLYIIDVFTGIQDLPALLTKTASDTAIALKYFLGEKVGNKLYSDNSEELTKACRELGLVHPTSTPHRPESNGLCEVRIRSVVQGTRCLLLQAGLPHKYWPLAGRCWTFSKNIESSSDDVSPWAKLHGSDFTGLVVPFGALVLYKATKYEAKSRLKFEPAGVYGIFLGYHVEPGMGHAGDYRIMNLESVRGVDLKVSRAAIVRVKEVVPHVPYRFPLRELAVKRQTTLEKDSPDEPLSEEGEEELIEDLAALEDNDNDDAASCASGASAMSQAEYDAEMKNIFGDTDDEDGSDDGAKTPVVISFAPEEGTGTSGPPRGELTPPSRAAGELASASTVNNDSTAENRKRALDAHHAELDDVFGVASSEEDIKSPTDEPASASTRAAIACPANVEFHVWNAMSRRQKRRTLRSTGAAPGPDETNDTIFMGLPAREVPLVYPKVGGRGRLTDRVLLEYCCGPESRLGAPKYADAGCLTVRLTETEDLRTDIGRQHALDCIDRAAADGLYVALWASLPCTAGSSWFHLNKKYPSAVAKNTAQLEDFKKLIVNFRVVADRVMELGGDVHFEWPTGCSLWQDDAIVDMVQAYSLHKVNFHGCSLGLRSQHGAGRPIKKPWTIATTSANMFEAFRLKRCSGQHQHSPCAGSDTKLTENYTDDMTDLIHVAIKNDSNDIHANAATAAVAEDMEDDCDAPPDGHRSRNSAPGLWCALVTKTLSPKDPESRSPPAMEAINIELADLRRATTWDEEHPHEFDEMRREHPTAHFARLFPIIGIKNWEDPDPTRHRWKGRVVLSGDAIKTATGDWAVFNDVGSVPSTMSAARIAIACASLVKGASIRQSDCIRAYIQADMVAPNGALTFVELPRAWWRPSWANMRRPVFLLKKALYGHPRAGDLWQAKLDGVLMGHGFIVDPAWPGVYYIPMDANGEFCIIVVYVDDLLVAGTAIADTILAKLRDQIEMDTPATITKYLGCMHDIHQKNEANHQTTIITFDMSHFLQSAVVNFNNVCAKIGTNKLCEKYVPTPYVPAIMPAQLDELLAKPGVFAEHAASLVMKLMYAARMALPNLIVAVGRLASELSRWTAESDRKLRRLYSYVHNHYDMKLTGTLSTRDIDAVTIIAWPDADLNSDSNTSRSHSGCWIELAANGRSFPLTWFSKRQDSTATHTCEAETVSLATCLKEAIPMQDLFSVILGRVIPMVIKEDNSAARIACTKGYSPAMRYLKRTQRVCIGFISDTVNEEKNEISIEQAQTATHKGDVFTKALGHADFHSALARLGMTF